MSSGHTNQYDASGSSSLVRRIDHWLNAVTNVMAHIGIGALVLAILVVVVDIIWRRVGGRSFIGAVDLTQFSVMAAASWSIPYAFSRGSHVTVDLVNAWLGGRATRLLDVIALLIGAALSAFLCWLSTKRALEVWGYGDVSQDLALPMIWFWAFLISGLAMSCIVCCVRALVILAHGRP